MKGMRLVVLIVGLVLVFATTAAAAGPIRATMWTSTTKPLVDTPWRYTIVVKSQAGKPLAGKVRLQILAGTAVVGCWKGTAMVQCFSATEGTWIPFKGKRTGVLRFPAAAVGPKLTFQATVVAAGRSLKLRAPVTVTAA